MEPSIIPELRKFIVDNFLFGEDSGQFAFSDEDSFQERGIVDSTGILELVCHLEDRYGIDVTDEDLVPDNLDSLVKVSQFVDRKKQSGRTGHAFAAS